MAPSTNPIRVLVVEDSRAQLALLVGLLQGTEGFVVVGTASNGRDAVNAAHTLRPDVIAMDIHLPVMDGYEATRTIMERCPTPIVMVSSSSGASERRSIQALAAGALTVIRKPAGFGDGAMASDRENFLKMLRLMSGVRVVTRRAPRAAPEPAAPTVARPAAGPPQVLAIAASTGGPSAVQTVLSGLGPSYPLPVLIAQHISRGFSAALAEWLASTIPLTLRIASAGETMRPGTVYLPPDDQHLVATGRGVIGLQPWSPTDRYCPSADELFSSVAAVYGARAIGVVLTGMGDDGARGLRLLRDAGGATIAQDEASCVVFGMPRAAHEHGAVTRLDPLAGIAGAVLALTGAGGWMRARG